MELDLEVAINLKEGKEGRREEEKGRKISHITGTCNLFPSFLFVCLFVFSIQGFSV